MRIITKDKRIFHFDTFAIRKLRCMEIKEVNYIGSFPTLGKCPPPKYPEFAFIGRSNVGKSSLINMLCKRKSIAHVSKKPGKTMSINYFLIDSSWYLVDLPGYGYAVRSKKMIKQFDRMINDYMSRRENLTCAFVLIDGNVPPQKKDLEFINWLGGIQVPFVIVYTKLDRLTKRRRKENIEAIQQALLETWNELPQQFHTSSDTGEGRDEIQNFIAEVNETVRQNK